MLDDAREDGRRFAKNRKVELHPNCSKLTIVTYIQEWVNVGWDKQEEGGRGGGGKAE